MNRVYSLRIKKLRKNLRGSRLFGGQAYLAVNAPDIFYFTGLNLEGVWLLVTKTRAFLFCSALLREQVKQAAAGFEVISDGHITDLLISFCKKQGLKRLYVDYQNLSHGLFQKISTKLNVINVDNLVNDIRAIKDESELKLIRKSCKIAINCFRYIRGFIKPGDTEIKIALKIEEYFLKKGVRICFSPIVASGPNSALPHHISSSRKIRKNDTVLIDLGCIYKGYCSDLTRTFFLGKITRLQKKVYSLVESAQKQGIKNAGSGKKAFEIDTLTREIFSNAGYEKYFVHSTGHGIGVEVHEVPRLGPKDNTMLKPGMAVTVEPGIYLPGRFGVRIEDTIEITKKGRQVLTV